MNSDACNECGSAMDKDELPFHCQAPSCRQEYCRRCIPVWCDTCGCLIGPNPIKEDEDAKPR